MRWEVLGAGSMMPSASQRASGNSVLGLLMEEWVVVMHMRYTEDCLEVGLRMHLAFRAILAF